MISVTNFIMDSTRTALEWPPIFSRATEDSGQRKDDGRIASGYGHLSGLTHAQLSHYIHVPTLSKRNLITGRQIHDKAKACILEAKKYLALWMEFLVDGEMPSGMNEDNALQFVMKRAVLLTSSEVVGDDDEEEQDKGKLGCKLSHHIFVCVLTFILTYG